MNRYSSLDGFRLILHLFILIPHLLIFSELIYPQRIIEHFKANNVIVKMIALFGVHSVDQFFCVAVLLFVARNLVEKKEPSLVESTKKRYARLYGMVFVAMSLSFIFPIIHLETYQMIVIMLTLQNIKAFIPFASPFGNLWSVHVDFHVNTLLCAALKWGWKEKKKLYKIFFGIFLISVFSSIVFFSFVEFSPPPPFIKMITGKIKEEIVKRIVVVDEDLAFHPLSETFIHLYYTNPLCRAFPFAMGALVATHLHFYQPNQSKTLSNPKNNNKLLPVVIFSLLLFFILSPSL